MNPVPNRWGRAGRGASFSIERTVQQAEKKNLRALIKGLVLIVTLVGVGVGLRMLGGADMLDTGWVDAHLHDRSLHAQLLFVCVGILFTGVGLPRQVLSFLGGYAFGLGLGTFLALLGTSLGCAASFYYARFLGREFIRRRFSGRIKKLDAVLRKSPFSMTLIIRFLPVGSNVLTSLVAGVSSIPAHWFILGSAVGFIPQTLIFALIGSGARMDPVWRTTLGVALFLVSGALGYWLYRRHRQEVELDD